MATKKKVTNQQNQELPNLNKQVYDRLQSVGCNIGKLFYVAAMSEEDEFLQEMCSIRQCDLAIIHPVFENYKDIRHLTSFQRMNIFLENDLYGFVAEVNMPEQTMFKLGEEGTVLSYKSNGAIRRQFYIYAETIEELINRITDQSKIEQKVMVDKELKERQKILKNRKNK